jgi:hypothetical protein
MQKAKNTAFLLMEVLAQLVLATVFKTVGSYGNHAIGGFDSHALPPFFFLTAGKLERIGQIVTPDVAVIRSGRLDR